MPPTLANGKICYLEIPAIDIAIRVSSAGTSENGVMAASRLTMQLGK